VSRSNAQFFVSLVLICLGLMMLGLRRRSDRDGMQMTAPYQPEGPYQMMSKTEELVFRGLWIIMLLLLRVARQHGVSGGDLQRMNKWRADFFRATGESLDDEIE
jgi:hypothetical protein